MCIPYVYLIIVRFKYVIHIHNPAEGSLIGFDALLFMYMTTYMYIHISAHIYIRLCVHLCIYTYAYVYIYIHTGEGSLIGFDASEGEEEEYDDKNDE